jgi:hypothetical protein
MASLNLELSRLTCKATIVLPHPKTLFPPHPIPILPSSPPSSLQTAGSAGKVRCRPIAHYLHSLIQLPPQLLKIKVVSQLAAHIPFGCLRSSGIALKVFRILTFLPAASTRPRRMHMHMRVHTCALAGRVEGLHVLGRGYDPQFVPGLEWEWGWKASQGSVGGVRTALRGRRCWTVGDRDGLCTLGPPSRQRRWINGGRMPRIVKGGVGACAD